MRIHNCLESARPFSYFFSPEHRFCDSLSTGPLRTDSFDPHNYPYPLSILTVDSRGRTLLELYVIVQVKNHNTNNENGFVCYVLSLERLGKYQNTDNRLGPIYEFRKFSAFSLR